MGRRVLFVHPDLGIGGAERLVVDAGMALKSKGHEVTFLTAHHDPSHCFRETCDGSLTVNCVGDWLPRSIFGRCYALCAYLRMIFLAVYAVVFYRSSADVVFLDQVSAPVPILQLVFPVVFYCHFPDLLLTDRQSWLKSAYRYPLDWLEAWTTGRADLILVNSRFTRDIFHKTFKGLSHCNPEVLYPSINTSEFDAFDEELGEEELRPSEKDFVFLSLNRYERKKRIDLAVRALALVLKSSKDVTSKYKSVRLIIAGGYDHRVLENVEYEAELRELAQSEGVHEHISFLRSISMELKMNLLRREVSSLIYTPSFEHFGIVPIEAMYCEVPVIAVDNGGPKESIANESTGFLVPATPEYFAEAMRTLLQGGPPLKARLGAQGRKRVQDQFSFESFSEKLNYFISKV